MTFASPSEMRFRSSRSGFSLRLPGAEAPCPRSSSPNFLSWGSQRSPLCRSGCVRPLQGLLPKKVSSRHGAAKLRTRSALVVSHNLGGLSRVTPCRFVAPCCRLWGSPRFQQSPPGSSHRRERRKSLPAGKLPSQWRQALRSVPLDSSSCRVTATDSLSPSVEHIGATSQRRKRRSSVVPLRTIRPQGLVPLSSPLRVQLRERCRICPILPWAFHQSKFVA
jgi:hypothetical protein